MRKPLIGLLITLFITALPLIAAEIHQAAWQGDLALVSKLITEDPESVNSLDERDCTPLHYASDGGHLETIHYLVQNGALKEPVDVDGDSPLHWACFAGHAEVVDFFLEDECNIDLKNIKGFTPLNYAAARQHMEVVDLLLDSGAKIEVDTDAGRSLLHDAAVMGHERLVKLMIRKGADIHHRRRDGETLLHSAASGNLAGVLKMLKEKGFDLSVTDFYDRTAADMAGANSAEKALMYLKENGQEPGSTEFPLLAGKYRGQTLPGTVPEMFAPGIISTGDYNERDVTFSPEMDVFYFTRYALQHQLRMTVFQSDMVDLVWTEPVIAEWSGDYADAETYISPGGDELFFISRRPISEETDIQNWEIWHSKKSHSNWSVPEWIGAPFEGGFYPTMTVNRTLYYTSDSNDIYRSVLKKGRYKSIEKLGPTVNTDKDEYNSMIAPDESFLVFTSTGVEDSYGGGDLYISFRDENDLWSDAVNLGPDINSSHHEFCPALSPDGKYFFFTSDKYGTNDIFWVESSVLNALKMRN